MHPLLTTTIRLRVAFMSAALSWSVHAQQPLAHEIDLEVGAQHIHRASSGILYYTTGAEIRGHDRRDGRTFTVVSGTVGEPTVSRAGDRMAFSRFDSISVSVWTIRLNPTTGTPVGVPRRISVRQGRGPEFSPDGLHVAFTVVPRTDTAITPRIVRVPVTGGPEVVVVHEAGGASPLRWSPDGKWIYYHHNRLGVHTLRRVPAAGGQSEALGPGGVLIGFSPDGQWLARHPPLYRRAPEIVVLISDLQGRDVARFTIPRDVDAIAWSPDATQLTVVRSQPRSGVRFVDLNGQVTELVPPSRGSKDVERSANGELIVRAGTGAALTLSAFDLRTRSPLPPPTPSVAPLPPATDCLSLFDIVRQQPVSQAFVCRSAGRLALRGAVGARAIPGDRLADLVSLVKLDDSTLLGVSPTSVVSIAVGSHERRTLFTVAGPRTMTGGLTASMDKEWLGTSSFHSDSGSRFHLIPLRAGVQRDVDVAGKPITGALWDPLRRFVLYVAEIDARSDIWIEPLNGDSPRRLTSAESNGVFGCCVIAPDGSGVAYTVNAGQQVSLWRASIPAFTPAAKGSR